MKRHGMLRLGLALSFGLASGCTMPFANDFHPSLTQSEPSTVKKRTETLPPQEGADVCVTLGDGFAAKGYDAEAILQYERARQYKPKLAGIAGKLGVLYDKIGDQKKAQTEFELALKEDPKNPDLLNDAGYACYNRGKWPEAEAYFRQALALKPKHERAWVNLGMALGQQDRYEEAIDAFTKSVSPAEAHANLGFVLTCQGKLEEAKAAYHQALTLEPGFTKAQGALARLEHPEHFKTAQQAQANGPTKTTTPRSEGTPAVVKPESSLRAASFVESIGPSAAPDNRPDPAMTLPEEEAKAPTPPVSPR